MNDGGMLRRCVCGSETEWLRQDSRACSGCYDVGTLADYLGVGTGVLDSEAAYDGSGSRRPWAFVSWRETPHEPEIDANDLRKCIAWQRGHQKNGWLHREQIVVLDAAEAWLAKAMAERV